VVLSSHPELVHELAVVSPLFYETDRIEVGRRLDYSRWINFVELPSSTRWSEISDGITKLLAFQDVSDKHNAISELISSLKPSDRITGETLTLLDAWLALLNRGATTSERTEREELIASVNRAKYFDNARNIIDRRLPLFLTLQNEVITKAYSRQSSFLEGDWQDPLTYCLSALLRNMTMQHADEGSKEHILEQLDELLAQLNFLDFKIVLNFSQDCLKLNILTSKNNSVDLAQINAMQQLQVRAALCMCVPRVLYEVDPILLFDDPVEISTASMAEDVLSLAKEVSKTCQCLYATSSKDLLKRGLSVKQYTDNEIEIARGASNSGDTSRVMEV